MFPGKNLQDQERKSFLCLRRGVSLFPSCINFSTNFSLPTQRCFCPIYQQWPFHCLFSAYAEVFPKISTFLLMAIPFSLPTQRCFLRTTRIPQISRTFLCLRRGVSPWTALPCLLIRFSLPTQRCFRLSHMDRATANLFSAYAEVFPRDEKSGIRSTTFLCLRRGVSHFPRRSPADPLFSLPTQRCFLGGVCPA